MTTDTTSPVDLSAPRLTEFGWVLHPEASPRHVADAVAHAAEQAGVAPATVRDVLAAFLDRIAPDEHDLDEHGEDQTLAHDPIKDIATDAHDAHPDAFGDDGEARALLHHIRDLAEGFGG
jgi:hypothetical protein